MSPSLTDQLLLTMPVEIMSLMDVKFVLVSFSSILIAPDHAAFENGTPSKLRQDARSFRLPECCQREARMWPL